MFDIHVSGPKGATVVLKGTKSGALFCVTRPKAVREIGLLSLGKSSILKKMRTYIYENRYIWPSSACI